MDLDLPISFLRENAFLYFKTNCISRSSSSPLNSFLLYFSLDLMISSSVWSVSISGFDHSGFFLLFWTALHSMFFLWQLSCCCGGSILQKASIKPYPHFKSTTVRRAMNASRSKRWQQNRIFEWIFASSSSKKSKVYFSIFRVMLHFMRSYKILRLISLTGGEYM